MSVSSELNAIGTGDHLCMIFDGDEGLKILILYIIDGLKKKEMVLVLNEEGERIKEILEELIDLRSVIDKQLIFLKPEEFYLRAEFDPDYLFTELCKIENEAIANGFKGLRIARSASFLDFNDERILEYEAKINMLEKTTTLCLYDARKFDDDFLKKIVRLHPRIIWRGKVLDNFKFDIEDEEDYPSLMEKITEMGELKKEFQRLEEQFKILFEGNDGIIILRGDTFVSCNSKALELFGVSKHELIGKKPWDFSPTRQPDGKNSRKKALEKINAALNGEPQVLEWRVLRDGEPVDLEISLSRFIIDGRYHLMAIARDITERKKMEEALRESEKKYRDLWEKAGDILFIIDQRGNFLEANKTARELFGYTREEVKKLSVWDVVDKRHHSVISQEIKKILELKRSKVTHLELLCYTKDGKAIWIESRAKPIIEDGNIKAIQGIARDITETKKMMEALKESEEKFGAICSASIDAIIMTDDSGKIVFWNDAATRIFGYGVDEALGHDIFTLIVPKKYHSRIKTKLSHFQKYGKGKVFGKILETVGVKKDGTEFPIEISLGSIRFQEKWHAVVIIRDITKRKRAEEELRESEEKYRKIFETSPILLAIIDEHGVFIEANPAIIGILGVNPVGKSLYEVLPEKLAEEKMEKIKSVIENSEAISFEASRGGREFFNTLVPIWLKGKKYCMIIAREMTEIKRMSKLLRVANEINKHLIREKDELSLIKSTSKKLNSLEYFSSWIGIKKDDILVTTSSVIGNIRLGRENGENTNCVAEALESKSVIIREGENCRCKKCEFYGRHKTLVRYIVPMVANGRAWGVFVIYSEDRIRDDEFNLLQTLANDLAFAINAIELEKAKLKAFEQIEKNIENYAILVDQIRNPLTIISGITEVKLDGRNGDEDLKELKEIIMEAVKRIEEVLTNLDKGWLESETIRDFLKGELRDGLKDEIRK